jgi:hypothetical protein
MLHRDEQYAAFSKSVGDKKRKRMRKQKVFSKTEFSDAIPVPWTPAHTVCGKGFHCLYPKFAADFRQQVPEEERLHLSRCFVIIDNNHLASYLTLQADSLSFRDEKGRKKKVSTADGDFTNPPAVRIGLLAADAEAKGAGKRLVKWALNFIAANIAPKIGARFVKVDAYYDANAKDEHGNTRPYDSSLFYQKLGFQYVDPNEKLPPKDAFRSMFFDLKPLID